MIRPPLAPDDLHGPLDEDAGGGALPLRIAGREMVADIAGAAGRQQRIGQGVEADIRVGMARQRLVVRNAIPQSVTWSPATSRWTS